MDWRLYLSESTVRAKMGTPKLIVFGRIYTLDLLLRALRRLAIWQALCLVYRVIRTRFCGERHIVYGQLTSVLRHRQACPDPAEFVVQSIARWPAMQQLLRTELRTWPRQILPDDLEDLWQKGSRLWIGRFQGQAATIAVSRLGPQVRPFFFPLQVQHALISHCGTISCYRGRGLYPAMLSQIAGHLAAEGITCIVIHCCDWNTSSRQGIERAGFQPIGRGLRRRDGQLHWFGSPGGAAAVEPLALRHARVEH